ncbi:ATP-binding protein [uncultured Adlercreutzia sp.]|uniref:ATP-binding protein n=1 Tax=uncultured Adlercreutzia sp. TaxID=875803 RepID=UPI002675B746|nr:4Fe-4S binding protein [uncultured Adlercreutzia sp.]
MLRKIIQIDEEKCIGCRLCVDACHEGAIGMVDGKARLLRDDYCDGLGDCLPACPTEAITFVEREAAPYDEAAVEAHLAARASAETSAEDILDAAVARTPRGGCPGSAARTLAPTGCPGSAARTLAAADAAAPAPAADTLPSRLAQWPAQIKLVPVNAPYYQGRGLLIAADCTAFACASFHERFMNGNVTIIGCPKLDEGSYTDKLAAIIAGNDITAITVARMEVPCCGGLERAAAEAHARAGKDTPFSVVTFSVTGDVIG